MQRGRCELFERDCHALVISWGISWLGLCGKGIATHNISETLWSSTDTRCHCCGIGVAPQKQRKMSLHVEMPVYIQGVFLVVDYFFKSPYISQYRTDCDNQKRIKRGNSPLSERSSFTKFRSILRKIQRI